MIMLAHFPPRITPQSYSRQPGFTLLELLVVVVIVAILFTYTTLAIRSDSPEDIIQEEAHRLERLIELALEESILRGEEYGIEVFVDGYRFLRFTDSHWLPLTGDKILRARELPANMEMEMQLEQTDIVITSLTEPMSDGSVELDTSAEADTQVNKKTPTINPHIFLLSSGEITPEFTIRFTISGIRSSYLVKGLFDGTLTAEISDL